VIVLLDSRRTGLRAGSIVLLSMQLSLTVSLAVLSYVLVERPIRAGALARRLGGAVAAWTWPVAMAVSIALLVVATRPPESYAGTPSADAAVTVPSSPAPVDRSIRVMMLGDSVAHSLAGGAILDFPHVAPWHPDQATVPGLWSLARPGCSFLRGQVKAGGAPLELVALCGNWLHDLDLGLTQHHSTHLVLLLVNDMYDRTVHGRSVPFGSAEYLTMLDALLDQIAHVAASHHVQLVLLAPAPREGEFAIPHDPSAAMYGLLTTAAQRLGAVALSLSDAPTTARADGLHYARADAIIVMRWLLAQLSTRKAPRISG
jgi:hypothetical protein